MITIVDYGVGNIGALLNMFEHLGIESQVGATAEAIIGASRLVLPGIGAYDKAMLTLQERGLVGPLHEAVLLRRTPVLGVCLGMQLLGLRSEEGRQSGLGWIRGEVRRITLPDFGGLKVPHIGWSDVQKTRPSSIFSQVEDQGEPDRFYFNHSYHMVCEDPADCVATIDYGSILCCAVQHFHVCGVQFHPEKSHRFGMRLLAQWAHRSAHESNL